MLVWAGFGVWGVWCSAVLGLGVGLGWVWAGFGVWGVWSGFGGGDLV